MPSGAISVLADGAGSEINFSALQSINCTNGGSPIQATNSGQILTPNLTTAAQVALTIGSGGVVNTAQITSFTGGGITASQALDLSGVTDLDGTGVTASAAVNLSNATSMVGAAVTVNVGGTVDLSRVTDIDGASFVVHSGTLALPDAVSYDGQAGVDTLSADGAGSVLDLSHVAQFKGASASDFWTGARHVNIQATNGGLVD